MMLETLAVLSAALFTGGALYVSLVEQPARMRLEGHPDQPELEVTLMVPGPPLDPDMAEAIERSLAKGTMGGFGLNTDDCQKTYEELSAQSIEFTQPPSERPYGVEALMRDNSGNWLVLVEPREYSPEDFAP